MLLSFFHFALLVGFFIASLITTRLVLAYLRHKAILDRPNERSSHTIPTPRGGGIGILFCVLPGLWVLQMDALTALPGAGVVLIAAFGLAALSWLDDLKDLGPAIRFFSQILAVSVCLFLLPAPENGYLGGFLPIWQEKVILAIGWVWFINLFNFMDGIDGISGVEIISISVGILVISLISQLNPGYINASLVLIGGTGGFLVWNWHKAKVFMGDVGSVPLGFILGWLLILLAGDGLLIPAVIIALYYLMDATVTLTKRVLRREKIWQAHREHYYQKATQAGWPHDRVVLVILVLNIGLILCAILAIKVHLWAGFACALVLCISCLKGFSRLYRLKSDAN